LASSADGRATSSATMHAQLAAAAFAVANGDDEVAEAVAKYAEFIPKFLQDYNRALTGSP
jgi:hypothetical protein